MNSGSKGMEHAFTRVLKTGKGFMFVHAASVLIEPKSPKADISG